jgi:magnesium transporter
MPVLPAGVEAIASRKSLVLLRRIVIPKREVVGELMRRDLRVVGDDLMPLLPGCLRSGAARRRVDRQPARPGDRHPGDERDDPGHRLNVITKKVTGWAAIIAVPTLITGFFGMNVPYPGFGEKAGLAASIATIALAGLWCSTSFSSARIGCKSEDREAGQLAALLALKFHQ